MLTPAEEMGLGGMYLAGRVLKAFHTLDEPTLATLGQRIRDESLRRHVVYLREGVGETIRLLPCPLPMLPDQLVYLHYVSLTMQNALKRLPELYLQDFAVREVLRLTPAEEEWLLECWGPSQQREQPDLRPARRRDRTSPARCGRTRSSFVEPNLSGIGGLHLVPTCEAIIAEVVLPLLQGARPGLAAGDRPGHPRAADAGSARPPGGDRPPGAQHLLRRAEVRRQRHRRAGGRGPLLPRPLRPEGHARRPGRADAARRRGLLRRRARRPRLSRLPGRRPLEPGEAAARTSSRCGSCSSRTASSRRSPPSWTRRAAGRCSPTRASREYFSPDERQVFRRHVLWTRILSDRQHAAARRANGRPACRTCATSARRWCSSPTAPTAAKAC